jgi:sec-independent protein translocase protein TatA
MQKFRWSLSGKQAFHVNKAKESLKLPMLTETISITEKWGNDMPNLGPMEIGLILLLVLVVFGAGKLPEVGSALGRSIREFNRAKTGEDEEKKERNTVAPVVSESKKTT